MMMDLRVLIIDDSPQRAAILEQALRDASCNVVARYASSENLVDRAAEITADVIIIDIESPDSQILENMRHITHDNPKPIVMFVGQDGSQTIQMAIQAEASVYVVDGLSSSRVKPILEVAIARFREFQALRKELAEVKSKLANRKIIDKAKGMLIEKYKMTEEDAYSSLRKMAMNRNLPIAEAARNVIAMLEMLG